MERHITWHIHQTHSRSSVPAMAQVMRVVVLQRNLGSEHFEDMGIGPRLNQQDDASI